MVYLLSGLSHAHVVKRMPLPLKCRSARRPESPNPCLSFYRPPSTTDMKSSAGGHTTEVSLEESELKPNHDDTESALLHLVLQNNNA